MMNDSVYKSVLAFTQVEYARRLSESVQEEKKKEEEQKFTSPPAEDTKSEVEAKLLRLDKAIDDSSHYLMRGMLKTTRERLINESAHVIIKSKSTYRYSMGDIDLMIAHLKSKGADNSTIQQAMLWMCAQKE